MSLLDWVLFLGWVGAVVYCYSPKFQNPSINKYIVPPKLSRMKVPSRQPKKWEVPK